MSRTAPRPLADALRALESRLAPSTPLARVQSAWESAAGEAIARCARPVAERDGVLTLACVASVWAQELDLMAEEILARLNRELGEGSVRELRCRVA